MKEEHLYMCNVIVVLVLFCAVVAQTSNNALAGAPLLLTPLLEQDQVEEAHRLARVTPDIANTTSYSGYFTINKNCSSYLFFWFFPAQKNWKEAPVMLWLQGGPGESSVLSIFVENGPFTHEEYIGIHSWNYSWNVENNLLYIDQPVGTGFSYTEKGCYAQNVEEVGTHLYSAVTQFFKLFPELKANKFYITGQSYAGHFIPALGHTIHKNNPTASVKINLAGMMIGSAWMDAVDQIDLGSYLYQHGVIDDEGNKIYQAKQEELLTFMKNKEYKKALKVHKELLDGIYTKYAGNISLLNYNFGNDEYNNTFIEYIERPEIRRALHVGNTVFNLSSDVVSENLGVDPVLSVKPWVQELLEHYLIVFYTGQLDVVCGYPMVANFLNSLEWSGKAEFRNSSRQKWCVGDEQAGYYKGSHNLYDVLVRKAGHSIAYFQPLWTSVLVNSVTSSLVTNPFLGLTPCK